MNIKLLFLPLLLLLGTVVQAQERKHEPPPHPAPLVIAALGTNKDGVNSAEKIANATVALASGDDQKLQDAAFWKSIYEQDHVVNIDISLTKESWEAMQPEQSDRGRRGPRGQAGRPEGPPPGGGPPPRGGGGTNFEYVKANIKIDGESFQDAGLRFKGNSSYRFSADGFKRPMKIDTNRFVTGQKLHGRTKLNLSNAYLDPAFMKEKLAYEIYQAAGIPTPGTGWATVTLSIEGVLEKKVIGIYVLIEQVDPNYLVRKFGEKSEGSLLMKPEIAGDWQNPGDDLDTFKETFNIKDGDEDEAQIRKLGDTLDFIKDGPDAGFTKKLNEKMDLDLYAGYLAATSLLASLDSYVASPHNYYLILDKADNKARLLPWDVNEAFGTCTMGTTPESLVEWDISRPWTSDIPLLERLFSTQEFPKLYKEKLSLLMKESFTEKNLFSRLNAFKKALKPHLNKQERAELRLGVDGDDSGKNTSGDRSTFAIKPFIKERIKSVNAQLAGKSKGVKIEGRGGHPSGGRPGNRPPRNRPAQPEETKTPNK